jgi:hypothetical protein
MACILLEAVFKVLCKSVRAFVEDSDLLWDCPVCCGSEPLLATDSLRHCTQSGAGATSHREHHAPIEIGI